MQVVTTTTTSTQPSKNVDQGSTPPPPQPYEQPKTEKKAPSPIAHDYNELMQMASSLLSGCVPTTPSSSSTTTPTNTLAVPNAAQSTTTTNHHQRLDQTAIKEEASSNNVGVNFNHKAVATSSIVMPVIDMQQNSELRNDVKLSNLFSPNTLHLPLSASKKFVRNSLIGSELNFSPVNMQQPADQCKSLTIVFCIFFSYLEVCILI